MKRPSSRTWARALAVAFCIAGIASLGAQPTDGDGERQRRPGGRGDGRDGRRGGDPDRFLQQMDTDADGKISAAEFPGPREIFDRMDANGDGFITTEEFAAGRGAFRMERGGPGGDPARFQEMMMSRLKERLGSDDEEWKVLQPKIQGIMDTQAKLRLPGGGFRGSEGDRRSPRPENPRPERATALPEADALRQAVENEQTPAEKLTAAIAAYREARRRTEAELQTERDELRKLLTARQEGLMMMAGILD